MCPQAARQHPRVWRRSSPRAALYRPQCPARCLLGFTVADTACEAELHTIRTDRYHSYAQLQAQVEVSGGTRVRILGCPKSLQASSSCQTSFCDLRRWICRLNRWFSLDQVRLLMGELGRLSLLWEEAWHSTLSELQVPSGRFVLFSVHCATSCCVMFQRDISAPVPVLLDHGWRQRRLLLDTVRCTASGGCLPAGGGASGGSEAPA